MKVYVMNRNYRVVNPTKFIISSIFSCLIIFGILYGTYLAGEFLYNKYFVPEKEAEPIPVYTFKYGDVNISTLDKEEYTNLLKQALVEQININSEKEAEYTQNIQQLKAKYIAAVKKNNQTTLQDFKLYNEYAYVLTYPTSDFTLDDIKMVIEICKKENVNPHLWFALVQLESAYNSDARSSKSTASGWGQVLKGTGKMVYERDLKLGKYDHATMGTDKEINAMISIRYLKTMIDKYGLTQGLINYNGGELGYKYVSIIENNLKKNTGKTLKQISKETAI